MDKQGFPDLVSILVNIGAVVPTLIMLIQGILSFVGLYLVIGSLVELWGASHDNALKFIPGRQRFTTSSALISMGIGALMLGLGTLELVGLLSRSITGDYASSRMTSDLLSYSGGGNGLAERAQLATIALLGIMQVVGLNAMAKALLTVNDHFNQRSQAGLGTASAWMIGGLLAWNFKWFSDVLNNTIGFNLIGSFTPF